MSNNQWNNSQGQGQGQGEGQWQPQGDWNPAPQQGAGDWEQGQHQSSAADWNTGQQSQGWNAGAQPQPSANDWNTGQQSQDWNTGQQAQGWNAGAQPQPPASDWNTGQGWSAGATAHQQQGWGDPNHQAGFGPGPGHPQWQPQQPRKEKSALGNVFDFSFTKFALPEAGGAVFLVAVVVIVVWWLADLINILSFAGGEFGVGAGSIIQVLLGGLARSVLFILLVRVFLEGMSALVSSSRSQDTAEAQPVEDTNPEAV